MNAQDTTRPLPEIPVANEGACLTPRQIADRLHDAPLQSLSAVRMLLMVLDGRLQHEAADVRQLLEKVNDLLDETCDGLTVLMKELQTATEQDSAANS